MPVTQNAIDQDELQRLTNTISGSRPNLLTVRIWKLDNKTFVKIADSDDSLPSEEIAEQTQNNLLNKSETEISDSQTSDKINPYYRVYSPVIIKNQVTGAVETVEKLETISSIAFSYLVSFSWIALVTILLMTLALYLVLQGLIYQPLENILAAMETAKKGKPSNRSC